MAEQVIDFLSKGDQPNDSPYDERVVMRHLRQSASRRIGGSIANVWANGERVVDHNYIATFNDVEIKKDINTEENYCDLPYFGHIFLFNNTQIQRVALKKKQGGYGPAIIPVHAHEMDIYMPLDAGYLENQWYYYPERHKIVFGKRNNKTLIDSEYTHVQIKAVSVDPNSIGDDDYIPVSEDIQADIIRDVIMLLAEGSKIGADMLTNVNPNDNQS